MTTIMKQRYLLGDGKSQVSTTLEHIIAYTVDMGGKTVNITYITYVTQIVPNM